MSEIETPSLGWLPDLPDFRDYTAESAPVMNLLDSAGLKMTAGKGARAKAPTLAAKVDLRQYCAPIENQGSLGSCTAQAGVGLLEYFARRTTGKHEDLSRLFIYKVTRQLMGWTGDTGAFLRSTMGAIAAFGAPPEKYWPYVIADFEKEPSAFAYAIAQNYKAITYYRLDPPGTSAAVLLAAVKTHLGQGLPSMFGFSCYTSLSSANSTGKIPFPKATEKQIGGHAVIAVGYDDAMKVTNPAGGTTTGALLIRNSWGTGWGESGYGWLPYEYINRGLAQDFWVLIKADWLALHGFRQ
jgi:C1A family cysteine protease